MFYVVFMAALSIAGIQQNVAAPAKDDWPMAGKDFANTRYSTLSEINGKSVGGLRVAWTFDTGINRGQEAAPIIVSNTMYVVTPFPNTVFAFDLRTNGTVKWRFDPHPK